MSTAAVVPLDEDEIHFGNNNNNNNHVNNEGISSTWDAFQAEIAQMSMDVDAAIVQTTDSYDEPLDDKEDTLGNVISFDDDGDDYYDSDDDSVPDMSDVAAELAMLDTMFANDPNAISRQIFQNELEDDDFFLQQAGQEQQQGIATAAAAAATTSIPVTTTTTNTTPSSVKQQSRAGLLKELTERTKSIVFDEKRFLKQLSSKGSIHLVPITKRKRAIMFVAAKRGKGKQGQQTPHVWCIQTVQPIGKPITLTAAQVQKIKQQSRRRAKALLRNATKPFVLPYLLPSGAMCFTPRLVSYYEVNVLQTTKSHKYNKCHKSTHIVIGMAGRDFDTKKVLPGQAPQSFGYYSHNGSSRGCFQNSNCPSHGQEETWSSYGPTFGIGDVVGCGIDYRHTMPKVFFTLNGKFIGYSHSIKNKQDDTTNDDDNNNDVTSMDYYPTLGVQGNLACLYCNFGTDKPFVFDLQGFCEADPSQEI